jgi:pyruvyltransferase
VTLLASLRVKQVEFVTWNPRAGVREHGPASRVRLGRRVGNFGDLLGPIVSRRVAEVRGCDLRRPVRQARLLTVGSALHFARDDDVVWGTGVNGHHVDRWPDVHTLDVRAVRGPRTRDYLAERGIAAPEIYGDPGLLIDEVWPELRDVPKRHAVTVCFNINDLRLMSPSKMPSGVNWLLPTRPVLDCVETIAASELVVGSALHSLIVAEALGVPARAIRPVAEPVLKYLDYFEGTGRSFEPADNVVDALAAGGYLAPVFDRDALLNAFPADLWHPLVRQAG